MIYKEKLQITIILDYQIYYLQEGQEQLHDRQIAMYLSKILTTRSLPEIGRKFGGRDHTTVIHAVKKIEDLRVGDVAIDEEVEVLRRSLEN